MASEFFSAREGGVNPMNAVSSVPKIRSGMVIKTNNAARGLSSDNDEYYTATGQTRNGRQVFVRNDALAEGRVSSLDQWEVSQDYFDKQVRNGFIKVKNK